MNDLVEKIEPNALSGVVASLESIRELQYQDSKLEQVEIKTEHYFSGGMYCRKMTIPAGTRIVGKLHKEAHFFILAAGTMTVINDRESRVLNTGDVIDSYPGVKRALYANTDCIGMNVHKTDKTDLDEIEKELLEDDPSAMFDARNILKFPVIEQ